MEGGFDAMFGQMIQLIEIAEPDSYLSFESLSPGNIAIDKALQELYCQLSRRELIRSFVKGTKTSG
jgi:hypothetical protein